MAHDSLAFGADPAVRAWSPKNKRRRDGKLTTAVARASVTAGSAGISLLSLGISSSSEAAEATKGGEAAAEGADC